jgi:selenocysteine lyase/cysteine desulfurase
MQKTTDAFTDLSESVITALKTYSNVHRGSGHSSIVSTHLYEQARVIVLKYMGLKKGRYVVIFCSPRGADNIKSKLNPENYKCLTSNEIGLPLGVSALAIKRKALPKGAPFMPGGGTTRLISPQWVVWASGPDRFEAGTPAIINIIAFARALQLMRQTGNDIFPHSTDEKLSARDILYHDELKKYSGKELLSELRQTLIGRDIMVPTTDGYKPYINLDNSASTPTFKPIWRTVLQTWQQSPEVQKETINEVRSICAGFLEASLTEYDLIFTSNTTEAINLAAESFSRESEKDIEPVVLSTLLEHSSNDLPWRRFSQFSIIRMNADSDGFLDLNELETILADYNQKCDHGKKRIKLLAVSGASNVLGSINNLDKISRIVHAYGARLLVDAAQLVAHRKIEMGRWNIDYLAFSAHKVYAPFGTGVLVVRRDLLNFNSSELEHIKSSGEENAGGIAALGKALFLIGRIGFEIIREEEQDLTKRALQGLSQIEGLKIYGVNDPMSPGFAQKGGVIAFTIRGLMSDKVAKELAVRGGIGVRYGCHCAHILVKHILGVPPSLQRFQRIIAHLFPQLRFPGVARVSLGIENKEEDIDTLIRVLGKIATRTEDFKQKEAESQINDFVKAAVMKVYSEL